MTRTALCVVTVLILGSGSTPPSTDEAEVEVFELNAEVEDLIDQRRHREALPLAERALELGETSLSANHLEVATACLNLARASRATKDYERALVLYERTLEIWREVWGPRHLRLIVPMEEMAKLHRAQRDYVQAAAVYERVLRMQEQVLGPQHVRIATTLDAIAGLYQLQRDYDRAENAFRSALDSTKEGSLEREDAEWGLGKVAEQRRRSEALRDRRGLLRGLAVGIFAAWALITLGLCVWTRPRKE